jgi:hypothetical protein
MHKIGRIAMVLMIHTTAAVAQSQAPEQPVTVSSSRVASLAALPAAASGTFDYIYYDWMECRVNWDQYCDGSEPVDAPNWPSSWQVCKALYTQEPSNNGTHSFEVGPANWWTRDPDEPVSFGRSVFTLHARGDGNPFHGHGALMRLNNVGVRLISIHADASERFKNECDLPAGP